MFESKPIDANDDSSDAESERFIAEIKPYIYAWVFAVMFGTGAAVVLVWSVIKIIWHLFTK